MANKVIPFPLEKPAPLLTKRWRTMVNIHGALYALDVTASYSRLPSTPAAGAPLPQPQAAQTPTKPPVPARRKRRSRTD
jgi:hypothetical protein